MFTQGPASFHRLSRTLKGGFPRFALCLAACQAIMLRMMPKRLVTVVVLAAMVLATAGMLVGLLD